MAETAAKCAYDVETGKIRPKSIAIECINYAYEDLLVQFGDGDIMLSELCRYHARAYSESGHDPA